MKTTFSFDNVLHEAASETPWVFVTLPIEMADEISESVPRRPGFGSIRVAARIGETEWTTSIFPSKADRSYLLPVKRAIREREGVGGGDRVGVTIRLIED